MDGGGIVKGILYRVADTKGVLRGRVFVKGILYRVSDTKGVLRGGRFCQWYIVLCRG